MKTKKIIGFFFIALLLTTLMVLTVSQNFLLLTKATDNYYSLIIDENHNNHPTLSSYDTYRRFNVRTERGTTLEFYEKNSIFTDDTCWCFANYTPGQIMNNTMISGLLDITVTYEEIESDYDSYVTIKYGWNSGFNNGLTKYEDSLNSGETFSFNNMKPSYFNINIRYAKILSIVVHFSCLETLPDYSDEDHYELVNSLSDINSSDIYSIASTKDASGYMMSRNRRVSGEDKMRMATACRPSSNQIANDINFLQLRITKTDDLYYFDTLNYSQGDGHFYVTSNKENTLYVDSDNQSGFSLSINANSELIMTFACYYSSANHTKQLYFYSDAQNTQFTFYEKTHSPVYLYKFVETNEVVKTLSYSNLTAMSKSYANGNYGKLATYGTNYEYYRTVRANNNSSGYAFKMVAPHFYYSDNGYPSSFYNMCSSPIYGIKSLTITYKADSGLKVAFAADYGDETITTLNSHSSYTSETINTTNKNFFKIMTNGSDAYIVDISITYKDKPVSYNTTQTYAGDRKSFTVYNGSYTPGVTTKTMYISSTETKTYTYYTYDYINSHPELKETAAMIDPVDVCNYFEAFGCAPANYGQTNFTTTFRDNVAIPSKAQVSSLFGSLARCMSKYTRTDGYATHVPYNNANGASTPTYYEFDIDTDGSYSVNSRQVGRVVAWDYGFSCYSSISDRIPVCVYTDDHYATFQEYNNMGGFSPRFDSERNITGYIHTPLNTVS